MNPQLPENETPKSSATPPRHWLGPEELEASYWANPEVREKRGQEFFEKPVELIAKIDSVDKAGFARRDFLTVMGASVALSTLACARRPVHKIIPYVVKPEDVTPGVANHYATTCGECSTGCGVVAKTREGRPIKLEGNEDHPVNRGALCARGQASLLSLYDPERLKAPVMRSRPGASHEVSWTDADAAIVAKLKTASRVRVLSGAINSPTTETLIQDFLKGFKDGQHVEYEPISFEDLAEAQALSYGAAVIPSYRFDQAKMVLSLGADFLGTWISPVEHAQAWAKRRRLGSGAESKDKFGKLVSFESTMTITGANADERHPVRPGDELKVALAIAHELILVQKHSAFVSDASVTGALQSYRPDLVAEDIGLADGAAHFKRIARELWENRGRSLVVGGGLAARTSTSLGLQLAVNLLNSALENEGATVDGVSRAAMPRGSFGALAKLVAEMKAGQVDVLVVYRANPAYAGPAKALGLEEAFKKVPLVISVTDREDETALWADYVLPDHHYLENWGDASPRKGLLSLSQPTLAPIYSTRSFQDGLIVWAKAHSASPAVANAADWHAYLMNAWKAGPYKSGGAAGSFEQFWEGTLRSGVLDGSAGLPRVSGRGFRAGSAGQVPRFAAAEKLSGARAVLALYSKISMGDGRSANNAWIQEMPDPISAVTWDNYLNVSPAMAKHLELVDDDVVEVTGPDCSAQLPVHIQPGLHGSVVSAAIGYGRRSVGKVGNEAGVDVYPFLKVENNRVSYSGQAVSLRKTGRSYKLASTQYHTATENRPIINDITLGEYAVNPGAANHTDPHLREPTPSIWSEHQYKGHRWGMAIDLTACTGCGACVIGCQAENNVPVVGRDQVRNSRNMHWIRIDRYYSGTPENPEVVFQPMLCQHCENAPCETVCPVLATVHDEEGLNIQVYNRCVGTRYCQNNCPYKVRRFNFFDHWKSYEGAMNLVWNPDVTVRSRGIMEKCTFCVQRITEAKDKAKDAGERVADGQLRTACQQTCPTDAIVFGDLNDPGSRASRFKNDPRAFRVLEGLNTKPVISYMSKVRNRPKASHGHGPGHGAGAAAPEGEHHG